MMIELTPQKQLAGRSLSVQPAMPVQTVPHTIRDSALMEQGGFAVFEGLVDDRSGQLLLQEAVQLSAQAYECLIPESDSEEVRGGRPARRYLHSPGGEIQGAFYQADWMLTFLRDLTSPTLVPTGKMGTYSYYVRPGDYLAIHRDIVTCDVAVITCLSNGLEPADGGGSLCLYPERLNEPLSTIRATPERGVLHLRLKVGQTIVMYGGIVPHALLPVAESQTRIVSVLCYEVPQETEARPARSLTSHDMSGMM